MGCSASAFEPNAIHEGTTRLQLSPAQKHLLRETWATVALHRFSVGKGTFVRYFQANPGYQKLFPEFKDVSLEQLHKSKSFYGHAKRVMKAVENAVTALNDPDAFSSYLEELGRRHKNRSLKPDHLHAMQSALMEALEELLQKEWTNETAEAWDLLLQFILCTMIKGLQSK